MAKHPTTTICKAAIPALLVSYSASVQAGGSTNGTVSNRTDTSNTSAAQTPNSVDAGLPRLVTVANASEQLNQYQGGKIDLNKVGFGQLQNIMDSFAQSNCAQEVRLSCRWKVLKLERTGRGSDGEQLSGASAFLLEKVAGNQKNDEPNTARPIEVASHFSQSHTSHDRNNKPRTIHATYQPQVIATTVKQRVMTSEWAQSFSAPHPDDTAIVATELATPIAIDLPQQSEVKLVVNGYEQSAENLAAGHSILDTTSLPEGSYPIEIHVTNDTNGQRIIHQMFGRRHLAIQQPTTSYGVFRQEPLDRRNAITTRKEAVVLHTTVVTSFGSTSGFSVKTSSDASRTADVTLVRRGNQYQLTLDGTISSQSALGNVLKAAYLGKNLTFSLQGIGFVPAQEMTGDPALARFLDASEYFSLPDRAWYQGEFVIPLIPIRRQDPSNGLVESRTDFATRLARVVSTSSASKPSSLNFRILDRRELGAVELHANFHTELTTATTIGTESISELEIETPFYNLA